MKACLPYVNHIDFLFFFFFHMLPTIDSFYFIFNFILFLNFTNCISFAKYQNESATTHTHIDFLLGWDIESMGDRGRLPAGLFLWKQISSSSSATFFFINLKAQLV